MKIELELSKDVLLNAIGEVDFSAPEKKEVLKKLFPHLGVTDNARIISDVAEFLYNN